MQPTDDFQRETYDMQYIRRFNDSILSVFRQGFSSSLSDPRFAVFFLKTLLRQKLAARIRNRWEKRDVHAPPLLIASMTSRCNLHCKGCYAKIREKRTGRDLTTEAWTGIIREAEELGVSIVMLAGGEPFLRPDLLDITGRFPKLVFPVFTNGLMLTDTLISRMKTQKQVIPVVSMEGHETDTDARRGIGVFGRLQHVLEQFRRQGLFFGISVTVTKDNFDRVTDGAFVGRWFDTGCKLFFFIEYTPVAEGTARLILTDEQRSKLRTIEARLRPRFTGIFIVFPGDEEQYGGCLASGRGFVHVGPDGDLEPCPFAPYSDTNLKSVPLREALCSPFLETIRKNHDRLSETRGGCSLWNQREWVQSLLQPEFKL